MADRAVARRYAQAYVGALEKARRLETGLEELKVVSQTYTGSREFQRFLGSPETGEEEKEKLLSRTFGGAIATEGSSLLTLLLKRDRIDHLPAIAEEAVLAAEARQGLLRGWVTTARPISSAEAQTVADAIGKLLGKRVVLERRIDPATIGGIRVAVGTTLLDGSIQAALENARKQLLGVKV